MIPLDSSPNEIVPIWRRHLSLGPLRVPLFAAVLIASGLLWLSWDIAGSKLRKVEVPGLNLVTIGMTRAQVIE